VGREYDWTSRRRLSDAALAALLNDPRLEVHVLMVDGVPAGFAELDRRTEGEIELVQFGLMSDFIGQGLGKYFLQWTIDKAWSHNPKRFWLHTCTKDHPAALPNYLKAGFAIYKEEVKEQE
jgi:GNAT superfamily N-acetyltransferase